MSKPEPRPERYRDLAAVAMLLTLHAFLAVHASLQHNVTMDESGHLLSGLLLWRRGDLDYYRLNPPLVKLIQAAPLLPFDLDLPDTRGPATAEHWVEVKDAFLEQNQERFLSRLWLARLANVLFSVGTGWLVYRWGQELFGIGAGLTGLALWTFCPNALGWAGVCTAEVGTAFFAIAAMWQLRAMVKEPSALRALWFGLWLGLAQLARFSLLTLYPVVLVIWAAVYVWRRKNPQGTPRLWHLAASLLVSLFVLNAGYGFQGSGRSLGSFLFKWSPLSGGDGWGNRFQGTWLESVPVSLPTSYVLGIDDQKYLEARGFPCYLLGEWQRGGWWYYYLVAAMVKVPLGTWLIVLTAVALALASVRYRLPWAEAALVWLPATAVLALLSSQTGINGHFRYALPALPFLFVGISRVGIAFERVLTRGARCDWRGPSWWHSLHAYAVGLGLLWNVVAVLRTHPHHIAYFNEVAGGADRGWEWLVESNIDFGQDLLHLKAWLEEHPQAAATMRLAYYGGVSPRLYGIDLPALDSPERLVPGWYAVSVNAVAGLPFFEYQQDGKLIYQPAGAFSHFQRFVPVHKAGYSIFIYRLTPADTSQSPLAARGATEQR